MNSISSTINKLLISKLEKYKNVSLSDSTCLSIYNDIFETFLEVFESAKVQISNESMNLISQMHYDSIRINNTQELNPNIFSQRASLKNIETKELALLASFFTQTPFAEPIILEIKKRS